MTLGTALTFAVVQNVVCLTFYFRNSPPELVAWRWSVCVIMHVVCTLIATRGFVPVWERMRCESRMPVIARAHAAVTAAILLHAACNVCVFAGRYLGYGF